MKIGDLVSYGYELPGHEILGILMRKLQYETDGEENWDGEPAWWIQFIDDEGPMWSYEEELTLAAKEN